MQVDNTIRVGQLVRINGRNSGDNPNDIYLVVAKHGQNCELLRANSTDKQTPNRRWWNASGLSVWV